MDALPTFALAWLRQREAGWDALAALEDEDLRQLDDPTALARADALLAATPVDATSGARRSSSGLIEQQRLFMRSRR